MKHHVSTYVRTVRSSCVSKEQPPVKYVCLLLLCSTFRHYPFGEAVVSDMKNLKICFLLQLLLLLHTISRFDGYVHVYGNKRQICHPVLFKLSPTKPSGGAKGVCTFLSSASNDLQKNNFLKQFVDNAIFAFVGVLRSLILYFVTAALYLSQVCDKVVDVASKREKNVLKLEKHIKLKDYTQRQASLIFDDKNSRPSNVQKNSVKSVSGRLDSSTSINMRIAEKKDTDLILSFIKELAAYEEMESSVIATSSIIQESLFPEGTPSKAEVIILELDEVPIGFALYFYNFSTFLGKYGLYIEDLYVRKEFRGKGYGKGLIENVCQRALLKDCGRVEWWCLDWNKKAIDFYLNLGAEAMVDWTVYRLSEKQIREIATPKEKEFNSQTIIRSLKKF